MTKIELAIAELKKLPRDEQEHLAEAILDFTSRAQRYVLTDEQAEEVRRRVGEKNPIELSEEEFTARVRHLIS
jgi:putative addiction module component (TIGR02574 family)